MAEERKRQASLLTCTDVISNKILGSANLAGSIAQLSQIKRKKNSEPYFDGHLSDGTTTLRFMGFDEELYSVLESHHSLEDSVILTKCNLAKVKSDTDRSPVVNKSPKKFEIPLQNLLANKKILLEQLTLFCLHDKVDVPAATVLKVHQPITIS